MPARDGEITPRRAAVLLGVHRNTIYNWCEASLAGEECVLPREAVRKTITKRIWIRRDVIVSLAESV